jgi:hypothetical protein
MLGRYIKENRRKVKAHGSTLCSIRWTLYMPVLHAPELYILYLTQMITRITYCCTYPTNQASGSVSDILSLPASARGLEPRTRMNESPYYRRHYCLARAFCTLVMVIIASQCARTTLA